MPSPIRRRRIAGGPPYPMLAAHMTRSASQSLSITDASQAGLNPGTSDFTLAFWAKPDSLVGNANFPIGKGATGSSSLLAPGYEVVNNATSVQVLLADVNNTTRLSYISAAPAFTIGAWSHLVLSFTRASNLVFYANGAASGAPFAISTQPASITTAAQFAIGAQSISGSGLTNTWDGALDTVAFWQRALTATEAALLYNNGLGLAYRDLSTGLRSGLVSWWDLDGSTTDAASGGNTLTNNNGVSFVPGKR